MWTDYSILKWDGRRVVARNSLFMAMLWLGMAARGIAAAPGEAVPVPANGAVAATTVAAVVTPPPIVAAPETSSATVVKVFDGATLTLRRAGQHTTELVALAGLDAPLKATREQEGVEPWGTLAQQYLSLQATRRTVTVEVEPTRRNGAGAGRPQVYLWIGDRLLNAELLREGHVRLQGDVSTMRHGAALAAAEAEARTAQRGVWSAAYAEHVAGR